MARSRFSGPVRSTGGFEVGTGSTNTAVIGSDGKISTNGVVTASITDLAVSTDKIAAGAVTNAKLADATKIVHSVRTRVTAAQVNAGHSLLAAVAGKKYRVVDWTMIAIGGNAGGATTIDLLGTQTTAQKLAAVAVAALTQSAVVKPNSANVTVLADGASYLPNDANSAITIGKTGSNLTTATNIDVMISYTLEN